MKLTNSILNNQNYVFSSAEKKSVDKVFLYLFHKKLNIWSENSPVHFFTLIIFTFLAIFSIYFSMLIKWYSVLLFLIVVWLFFVLRKKQKNTSLQKWYIFVKKYHKKNSRGSLFISEQSTQKQVDFMKEYFNENYWVLLMTWNNSLKRNEPILLQDVDWKTLRTTVIETESWHKIIY